MKPKITRVARILTSRIFSVESIDLVFTNGEHRTYERMLTKGNEAVLVVPFLDQEHLCLVREYAAGVDRYELGLVKGVIDAGETVEQAALRELQEEAGYAAKKLRPLKKLCTSPGYMSSIMHVVLAEDLTPSALPGDEPEPLEVIPWRFDQLDVLLARDDVTDARVIAALLLVKKEKEKKNG